MRFAAVLRYAMRELKAHPRYTALFVMNVVIGLSGLAVLESFKASITKEVRSSSRATAGGDLVLSSRIRFSDTAISQIDQILQKSGLSYNVGTVEEVFSMATVQKQSRLVLIRAMDEALPFYGKIELDRPTSREELSKAKDVWAYPELLTQFQVSNGESVLIGDQKFKIAATVTKDFRVPFGRGSLAPVIYMSRDALREIGLIQKGSTVSYEKIYQLGNSSLPEDELESLASEIKKSINDSSVDVRTHGQVSEASARLMTLLNDYLGLITLIALLLSNIGTIYLFRAHLTDRIKDVATLKILGLSVAGVATVYLVEILVLGFLGVAIALTLSYALFPALSSIGDGLLPFSVAVSLDLPTSFLVAVVGLASTIFCLIPLIQKARSSSANQLFQETANNDIRFTTREALAWVPSFLLFFALAIWQAHSVRIASVFVGTIGTAAIGLFLVGWLGLTATEKASRRSALETRYAFRELARRPLESLTVFVALALGALLASLVLTIEGSLQSEFSASSDNNQPSLFLFDIQEEQMAALETLAKETQVKLDNVSPLIRARLEKINDQSSLKNSSDSIQSREEEASERTRNRSYNLSERNSLSASEVVTKGRYFTAPYSQELGDLPEISVEERFAERMGIQLGDKMTFDIMGVPVEGSVMGFRRVKWASFQPNFFIQFQEGVFADAPKTFIASTRNMADSTKQEFQAQVVKQLPNVSVIDVSRAVERLIDTATQMAWALKLMAALVLVAATAVVISIQSYHVQRATKERGTLHLLGLRRDRIRKIETIESWVLSLGSVSFGWLFSFLVAWPITHLLFQRPPSLSAVSLIVFASALPSLFRIATSRLKHEYFS